MNEFYFGAKSRFPLKQVTRKSSNSILSNDSAIWKGRYQKPLFGCCWCCSFETGSHYSVQAGLEHMIPLPQIPECWNCRCVPPHPAIASLSYCLSATISELTHNYCSGMHVSSNGLFFFELYRHACWYDCIPTDNRKEKYQDAQPLATWVKTAQLLEIVLSTLCHHTHSNSALSIWRRHCQRLRRWVENMTHFLNKSTNLEGLKHGEGAKSKGDSFRSTLHTDASAASALTFMWGGQVGSKSPWNLDWRLYGSLLNPSSSCGPGLRVESRTLIVWPQGKVNFCFSSVDHRTGPWLPTPATANRRGLKNQLTRTQVHTCGNI